MDYTQLTDTELQEIFHAATEETSRRNLITAALTREPILQTGYLTALGRADGEEYVAPTGAHDAYPQGWKVTHNGKTWESLVPFNVWEPGIANWRKVAGDDGPAEWVQPTGAHDAYKKGDQITYDGHVWTSSVDANTWAPGTGDLWLDLGPML